MDEICKNCIHFKNKNDSYPCHEDDPEGWCWMFEKKETEEEE